MTPKLIVEQKITAFVNQYAVYKADDSGEKIGMVAFAQQKRLAFKEKVTFYADETKDSEVFSFRAEKAMDIHGRFFVEDPSSKCLGAFRKDFKQSLLNSTWHILDSKDQPTITIKESNHALAVFRRVGGLIPIVGEFVDIIVAFLKYHFVFQDAKSSEEIGKYQKTTVFRDNYTLHMQDKHYKKHDWRILAAMAVALDALQSR